MAEFVAPLNWKKSCLFHLSGARWLWAMDKYQPIGSINTMNQVLSARRARQLHKGLCDRTPSGDVLLTHIDHHPAAGIDMRQPPLARLRLQPSHNQILLEFLVSLCLGGVQFRRFHHQDTRTPISLRSHPRQGVTRSQRIIGQKHSLHLVSAVQAIAIARKYHRCIRPGESDDVRGSFPPERLDFPSVLVPGHPGRKKSGPAGLLLHILKQAASNARELGSGKPAHMPQGPGERNFRRP